MLPVAVHVELTHVYVSHALGPLHDAPFGIGAYRHSAVPPTA